MLMHRNLDIDRRFIASLCHNQIIYDKYDNHVYLSSSIFFSSTLYFFTLKEDTYISLPVTRSTTIPPASEIINDAAAISHVEMPGPSI